MFVCVCTAEGKPPGPPTGIYASETDRTYVVLSWKAPAYSKKAPMWYYIEKVINTVTVADTTIYCVCMLLVHLIFIVNAQFSPLRIDGYVIIYCIKCEQFFAISDNIK